MNNEVELETILYCVLIASGSFFLIAYGIMKGLDILHFRKCVDSTMQQREAETKLLRLQVEELQSRMEMRK